MRFEFFGEDGPVLIKIDKHHDERGVFFELFNSEEMLQLNLPEFVQDNVSLSRKNVFRGMHWQTSPMGQGKMVTCLSGSILDFALDIRQSSSSFGEVLSVKLDSNDISSFWIPEGFAHGFLALEDNTTVHYKVSNFWSKKNEVSISPFGLGLELPAEPLLSKKDEQSPSMAELDPIYFF